MTNPRLDQAKILWAMPKEEFNKWRRENDLPRLLAYFKSSLPNFQDWMTKFNITDNDFINLNHTSNFFIGTKPKYLFDADDHEDGKVHFVCNLTKEKYLLNLKLGLGDRASALIIINSEKEFVPFFEWRKRLVGTPYFPTPNDLNNGLSTDFHFMSYTHALMTISIAHLFYNHQVLKLGGISITPQNLDTRNLDFVDLDGLKITGSGWTRSTEITYSSCRYLKLSRTDKSFLTFRRCSLEKMAISKSSLQDLHFVDCTLESPRFVNSKFFRLGFRRSSFGGMQFDNSRLSEVFLSPSKTTSFSHRAYIHKTLRTAFQRQGDRTEVSRHFFCERLNELLASWSQLLPNDSHLPRRTYVGSYKDLYFRWKAGQFKKSLVLEFLFMNFLRNLKILFFPNYWPRLIRIRMHALIELLDYLTWGFGEKPGRVFLWCAGISCLFWGFSFSNGSDSVHSSVMNSLSCTMSTFVGMGCSEMLTGDLARLISGTFAVSGTILAGLLVAGFANRTRY